MLTQIFCLIALATTVCAAEQTSSAVNCPPGVMQMQYSSGICVAPNGTVFPVTYEVMMLQPRAQQHGAGERKAPRQTTAGGAGSIKTPKTIIYFFWGKDCSHCAEQQQYLDTLKTSEPFLEIRAYEVWYNKENAGLLATMLRAHGLSSCGVPVTFVHDKVFSGFNARSRVSLENEIARCRTAPCADPLEVVRKAARLPHAPENRQFSGATTASSGTTTADTAVSIPFLGNQDARNSSLPLLTLLLAGMDSFNPCAFFVLLSLLGVLVHAQTRHKMLLIGGIFVFFSGFIYFLFMAAWLNLFLLMGHVAAITMIAGGGSIVIAAINIKDFFLFKRGVSLSIPDSAKPGLFARMRELLRSMSLVSVIIGTTALAIVANFYELLCTAGFPMVFTRILTLHGLPSSAYYLYLLLYNVVYVIPLFIIVLGVTFTLGRRKLSEWEGRILKLMSGNMMLGLGIVLLVKPALLNSALVSVIIVAVALGVTLVSARVTKLLGGAH
jgi:hypothetical protein